MQPLMGKALHIVGNSQFGGGAVIVLQIARMAQEQGWDVDVLTTDATLQRTLRERGVGVVDLDVIWRDVRPLRDLRGLGRLYQFLRARNYTLVHTHTSKAGFVGRLAARLAGVPAIIHTVHGFAFHEESSVPALQSYAMLERLAAHWCDRIITVSEFHRDWALRLGIGDPGKVEAIPNGISEERVLRTQPAERTKAQLGLKSDEFAILTTGRLARQKGLEDLINSLPLLAARSDVSFKVLLAGEGPLRPVLEEQARCLGVQDRIMFLGFCSQIGDLLAASNVVALPSLREGLSIALLEAMAAGKPIVTTTLGSNREALADGRAGLLVPTKQPSLLAEAILRLARDPSLCARLGEEAQRVYRERYTASRMLRQYALQYARFGIGRRDSWAKKDSATQMKPRDDGSAAS